MLVTYGKLLSERGSGDVANCGSSGREDVGHGVERGGNDRSIQGWGSKKENAILSHLLSVDRVRKFLELVDLHALLALHILLVLLDLALLG